MKKGFLTVALLAASMAIYAQNNTSTTSQTGGGNSQTVSQTGSNQTSSVEQKTPAGNVNGHKATVTQKGDGNQSEIFSNINNPGTGSEVTVNQLGQSNASEVFTQGMNNKVSVDQSNGASSVSNNDAYVEVAGRNNEATINQSGSSNNAKIFQGLFGPPVDEGNKATIDQSGSSNSIATINQYGNFNTASMDQSGNLNSAISYQSGNNNTTSTNQSSNSNQVALYQGLFGTTQNNKATAIQAGNGGVNGSFLHQQGAGSNEAEITQDGDGGNLFGGLVGGYAMQDGLGNKLFVKQTSAGSGHTMSVHQQGDGNIVQGLNGGGASDPALQVGSSNFATLTQTGNFDTINFFQNGSGNIATITQSSI